jgi:hypothetical protein
MAALAKLALHPLESECSVSPTQPFFSIPELAERWRCSRGTVYNVIRGEKVLDFAEAGHRGKKLVPAGVVCRIEKRRMQVFR